MDAKMEYLPQCLSHKLEGAKNFIMEKFDKQVWGKELGRTKKYYIEEFNPMYDLQQKEYIGARAKVFIAQLRTNWHQLGCEEVLH